MNVLVVSEPGVDGVFRYVEALCHFLVNRGIGVHLAYSDRRGSDRLLALVAWVEAHGGRTVNLRTANRPAFADVSAFLALRRLVRAVKPDVIHSHSSKAGFLARAMVFAGVRAAQVYHPHAYVGMRPVHGRFDVIYNTIEGVLGRVSHTVVVSRDENFFARSRLLLPAARLHLIPNGIDTGHFSPAPAEEKRRLRAAAGLPPDLPVLGFMGRSSPQKDPLTLYRAFALIAATRPVALYHVGHGELDAELARLVDEAQLRHRVFRRDYTAAPAEFYRAVDGFILTSHYEGLSLAALEALSANLPLILSEAPGNRDLLALPLSHAWSAAPGDIPGFARAIAAWLDRLPQPAAVNHRWITLSHFALHDRFNDVLELYHRLCPPRALRRPPPRLLPPGALKTESPPP